MSFMNEYFQVNIQEIIPLVKKRPVLWDRRMEFFKHKAQTLAAWDEICTSSFKDYAGMSGSARSNYRSIVIRKWRNVKDSFRKFVIKKKRGETGSKNYIYEKELAFLKQGMKIVGKNQQNSPPSTPTLSGDELSTSLECPVKSETLSIDFEEKWLQDETNTEFSYQCQNQSDSEIINDKTELGDTSKKAGKSTIIPDKPHQVSVVNEAPAFSYSQNTANNAPGSVISQSLNCKEEEDRHVSFMKGVLPSIRNFNEEQVLKFQMGVIQLIQSIRENN